MPIEERRQCRMLLAELSPNIPYEDIKCELGKMKNQFITIKKHKKLIAFLMYQAYKNSGNNYA
jgi:hypothetical protein